MDFPSSGIIRDRWLLADYSGAPTSDPGSGKPWLRPDGALGIGAYAALDLSNYVAKTGNQVMAGNLTAPALYATQVFPLAYSGAPATVNITATGGASTTMVMSAGGSQQLAIADTKLLMPSTWGIDFTNNNYNQTVEGRITRNATGQLDLRADNGFRIRNLANNAFSDAQLNNLTAYGFITLGSGADILFNRNAPGQTDFRGDAGIRSRNFAGTADAPISGSIGTFSGNATIGGAGGAANLYLGGVGQYWTWTNQASASFVSNGTSVIGLHGGATQVNLGTNWLTWGSSIGYNVKDIQAYRLASGSWVLESYTGSVWVQGLRQATAGGVVQHGFYGATPVSKQSAAAAATDPATTQTLANSLRTILINLGLCN